MDIEKAQKVLDEVRKATGLNSPITLVLTRDLVNEPFSLASDDAQICALPALLNMPKEEMRKVFRLACLICLKNKQPVRFRLLKTYFSINAFAGASFVFLGFWIACSVILYWNQGIDHGFLSRIPSEVFERVGVLPFNFLSAMLFVIGFSLKNISGSELAQFQKAENQ
jgi:hypothetical protein